MAVKPADIVHLQAWVGIMIHDDLVFSLFTFKSCKIFDFHTVALIEETQLE